MASVNLIFKPSWPKALPDPKEQTLFQRVQAIVSKPFSNLFFSYGLSFFKSEVATADPLKAKKDLKSQYNGEKIPLKTPDGKFVDNIFFRGLEKKAVIYCADLNGFESKDNFNSIYDIAKKAGDLHLLLLNPRGISNSKGAPTPQGMAIDVYTTFAYLVEQEGFSPEDIVIYGKSFAGGYAALGAELIQTEYPEAQINFISEQSFCSLTDQVHAIVLEKLAGYPRIAHMLGSLSIQLLQACNWMIDSEKALQSLKGKMCVIYNKHDEAIPFDASLYKRLKQKKQEGQLEKSVRCIKMQPLGLSPSLRKLTSWEKYEVSNELKRMLNLSHEEPIDLKHVKEIKGPCSKPADPQDASFELAHHTLIRLQEMLEKTPADFEQLSRTILILFDAVKLHPILFRHFEAQEHLMKQGLDLSSIDQNPEQINSFFQRLLNRIKAAMLLEQLESKIQTGKMGLSEKQLLSELEQIVFHHEDEQALKVHNLAHCLYYHTYHEYQQMRSDFPTWPSPDDDDFGRHAFNGEIVLPNIVRMKALEKLRAQVGSFASVNSIAVTPYQ